MSTDEEIFAAAMADDPPADDTPPPEQSAQEPAPMEPETAKEPQRDDKGRFAPSTPAEPASPSPPAPEPKQEGDHRVPLMELLNERERRQQFEREIAEERKARTALERQIADFQRKSEPPPPAPDIFENPQGFIESLEQKMERRLHEQEANFSMKMAHRQYGKDFEAAYDRIMKVGQSGDSASVQRVISSSDPGEALMRWHREQVVMEKTGGDLDGYLKTREEQLLDDPEFMKRVAEKIRSQSSSQNGIGSRPAPQVQMPPSLSKVPSAAHSGDDGDNDGSDAAMFRYATRR